MLICKHHRRIQRGPELHSSPPLARGHCMQVQWCMQDPPPSARSARTPAAAAGSRSWGWHRSAQPWWQPGSAPSPALSLSSGMPPGWWCCGTPRPGWHGARCQDGALSPWETHSRGTTMGCSTAGSGAFQPWWYLSQQWPHEGHIMSPPLACPNCLELRFWGRG